MSQLNKAFRALKAFKERRGVQVEPEPIEPSSRKLRTTRTSPASSIPFRPMLVSRSVSLSLSLAFSLSFALTGCGITPPPVPEGDRIPVNYRPAPAADSNHLVSSSGDCITTGSLGMGSSDIVCPERRTDKNAWGVEREGERTPQSTYPAGPVGGYSAPAVPAASIPVETGSGVTASTTSTTPSTSSTSSANAAPAASAVTAVPAVPLQPAEPAVLKPAAMPADGASAPESVPASDVPANADGALSRAQ